MNSNLNVQGFFLIDVDVVALNNSGKSSKSNNDNVLETKSITKNGEKYTYVSGQALRFWWRNSLQKNYDWKLSPIMKDKKIAYTEANPIEYPDDDVFGYAKLNKNNLTRVSPLKNSALISVCPVRIARNNSVMARQNNDPVPYIKEEYSAIMKGMFSLDLNMLGTFSSYNRAGFQNLNVDNLDLKLNQYSEIEDPYISGEKLIQLPVKVRVKRATETIKALKNISGGAMQTCNMGDVTPKFIVLALAKTGNHPFSHIVSSYGDWNDRVKLNIEALKEVIEDYKDDFIGKIYIGKRTGFWDELNLQSKLGENNLFQIGPVNQIIDEYCEFISNQMESRQ